ncbi:MAG TPA: calcium-binding protein [Phenylobacterium sp.]|uniref:calcium-binding protein n=1 Tax=Phenylobacterium sp. TaxID=1871053 RepID=UPI002F954EE5
MNRAESLGIGTMLTFASTNTLYDSGLTPYTPEGRQAYANYILEVLDKYGDLVQEVEVWNEFNADNFIVGPVATDRPYYYTELLKTVYATVKPFHPEVEILGGAAHSVATGYLEDLFEHGALDYMDGVALHPYRNSPEHVDDELRHLNEVMERFGGAKPVYATEFGNEFVDPAAAPDYLVKMVTMLSSSHVAESYWYALQDEAWFRNMGLFETSGAPKPAAAAFEFAQRELLPLGDAVQVETSDDLSLVYRFGEDTYVMWGAPREIAIAGEVRALDSSGRPIETPTQLSMSPVVLQGDFTYQLGESPVVADSLMEYGEGEWDYFARTVDGMLHPLGQVDWEWTSYIGSVWYQPLRINADNLSPAGSGANPIQAVARFTSEPAQKVEVTGNWSKSTLEGDGVDLHILLNGREIFNALVTQSYELRGLYVNLQVGDVLDFAVGPNQTVNGDSTNYLIQLLKYDGPEPGISAPPKLIGTEGDDTLIGTARDEMLIGGAGLNLMDGGEGVDTVSYATARLGVNVDLAREDFQAVSRTTTDALVNIENLTGSPSSDTLSGAAGDNRIVGADGADSIFGGAGADTLTGSHGGDTLTGGDGADLFVFRFTSDSTGTGTARDLITDFDRFEGDKIDISGIDARTSLAGDQPFTFVTWYTKKPGEVMAAPEAGGYVVKGDINGDGASEFMIKVMGPAIPTADDFIL